MVKDKTEDQEQESEEVEETATKAATEEAESEDQELDEESEDEDVESEDEEESEDEDTEEEESEDEEEKPSRRQNKAIERLTKKLAEASTQGEPTPQLTKEEKRLIEEGEYTLEELNQKAKAHGDERYKQGLTEAQQQMASLTFVTRLEIDTPKVAQKYPLLDENSDKFDPAIADYINRNYLRVVGFDSKNGTVQNPNIRYEEYADATMELIDTVAASRTADSQKNVARQAAKAGVRPGGTPKKSYQGNDPSQMSDEQLTSIINKNLGITPR